MENKQYSMPDGVKAWLVGTSRLSQSAQKPRILVPQGNQSAVPVAYGYAGELSKLWSASLKLQQLWCIKILAPADAIIYCHDLVGVAYSYRS